MSRAVKKPIAAAANDAKLVGSTNTSERQGCPAVPYRDPRYDWVFLLNN